MARIKGRISCGCGRGYAVVGFNMCSSVLAAMVVEIFSELNQHGTRVEFRTSNPSPEQLAMHYEYSGGFQRFIDSQPTPLLLTS